MPKAFRWFNAGGHIKAMNEKNRRLDESIRHSGRYPR